MPGQLMKADLDFKSSVSILLVDRKVLFLDEWNFLVWCLGTENIAEGYILEAFRLPNIIILYAFSLVIGSYRKHRSLAPLCAAPPTLFEWRERGWQGRP